MHMISVTVIQFFRFSMNAAIFDMKINGINCINKTYLLKWAVGWIFAEVFWPLVYGMKKLDP